MKNLSNATFNFKLNSSLMFSCSLRELDLIDSVIGFEASQFHLNMNHEKSFVLYDSLGELLISSDSMLTIFFYALDNVDANSQVILNGNPMPASFLFYIHEVCKDIGFSYLDGISIELEPFILEEGVDCYPCDDYFGE